MPSFIILGAVVFFSLDSPFTIGTPVVLYMGPANSNKFPKIFLRFFAKIHNLQTKNTLDGCRDVLRLIPASRNVF